MLKKVFISDPAKHDLERIVRYIRLDKPQAAEAFKTLLIKKARSLTRFSEKGKKVPELKGSPFEDYREIVVGPCRLIYKLSKNEMKILRILHSRQAFTY